MDMYMPTSVKKNAYWFKIYFTSLIKDFKINTFFIMIKNPQFYNIVDRMHQVIYKIIVMKYFSNNVFNYIL